MKSILAAILLLLAAASSSTAVNVTPIYEALDNHNDFIVANGWGPARWGCSFTRTQVHNSTDSGTTITIGTDSLLKPYSCGELIHKQYNLSYGTYSIDMIASNVVGQVTAFFLIANEGSEIDIELTGLNNKVGWMNVWHDQKQNPVSIDLPFDTSLSWHSYSFDWFRDHIVWRVDGQVVLNRSDIQTTSPDNVNYKLAINSWTQVQPEINIQWAGKFSYPTDGQVPEARFKNMKYVPRIYGTDDDATAPEFSAAPTSTTSTSTTFTASTATTSTSSPSSTLTTSAPAQAPPSSSTSPSPSPDPQSRSSAELSKNPTSAIAIGATAILAVGLAFTVLF